MWCPGSPGKKVFPKGWMVTHSKCCQESSRRRAENRFLASVSVVLVKVQWRGQKHEWTGFRSGER